MFKRSLVLLAIILGVLITACTPKATAAPPITIRFAMLPIIDALPMYVAEGEGLFEKHNIILEFIPVGSAAERDQIMAAGQADSMINDTVSTLFYNKDQTQIQNVRFARTATETTPQYHILASSQSGITTAEGLKGVEIGISQGTVIEYVTDRLLQAEGFQPGEIKTVAVPNIAERMTLLGSGELGAATLPDPFPALAMQSGAVDVLNDSKHPEYGYSVISFRKPFIDQNPEAVRGFLAAIEEAVELINADPAKYQDMLVEQKLVPAPVAGSYSIPPYPKADVPSQSQWQDVLDWAKEKGLLDKDVSYESSVTDEYLP